MATAILQWPCQYRAVHVNPHACVLRADACARVRKDPFA
jgi:hypothetical protein